MPPKKPTGPPKKGTIPQPPKKATAKSTTTKSTPSTSTTPINKNHLITSQTSPVVVKKAFGKLSQLFRALINDMDQPLPPKAKLIILDKQGWEVLSKKLSHAVTKYVLFICQEGTIKLIESETQILLNVIRSVCVSLRSMHKDAGITLQISIAETGTTLLELLTQLMNDLSEQISTQWKNSIDSNGKFQSPLDSDDKQIIQITAQIWTACQKLATMPLNDRDAILVQGNNYLSMIKDALNEAKTMKEGEHEFPMWNDDDGEGNKIDTNDNVNDETKTTTTTTTTTNITPEKDSIIAPAEGETTTATTTTTPPTEPTTTETTTTTSTTTDESTTLSKEEQELNDMKLLEATLDELEDNHFDQNELSQSEFVWFKHGKAVIEYTHGIVSTFITKILPNLQHPATIGDVVDLKVPGSLNQQKQFTITLERRLKDIEKITYYIDMMAGHLYSPQNIPHASKYCWFILSKLSRLLLWLDIYYKQGWLKHIFNTPNAGMVFLTENDQSKLEENQQCSSKDFEKVYVQHSWWLDQLINPSLRPIVTAKNNQYVTQSKLNPQYNRIHEFDDINNLQKLTLISQWKWINFQRKELFLLMYTIQYTDKKNLVLEYFKLKGYKFPIPTDIINTIEIDPKLSPYTIKPIYNYVEDDLFDDKEDVAPDSDDDDDYDDEDYDEDDDVWFFDDEDDEDDDDC